MKTFFALLLVLLVVTAVVANEEKGGRVHHDRIAEFVRKQRLGMMKDPQMANQRHRANDRMTNHLSQVAQRMKEEAAGKDETKRSINAKSIFHSKIEALKKLKASKVEQ